MSLLGTLLDWLNPWSRRADRRGERELEITEERFNADKAAKLGARYERGEPPRPMRPSVSSPSTGTTYGAWSVRHVFLVACAGLWYAEDVAVWLAYGDGYELRRTDEKPLGLLRPVEADRKVEFVETEFAGGRVPREGALMCRWTDGNGTHVEPLLDVTVWI